MLLFLGSLLLIAGAAVQFCEQRGLELSDLTPEQLGEVSPRLGPAVLEVLSVAGSIDSRDGRGGTATPRVGEQLAEVLDEIDDLSAWLSMPVGPAADLPAGGGSGS